MNAPGLNNTGKNTGLVPVIDMPTDITDMPLSHEEKKRIAEDLDNYCTKKGGTNRGAQSLRDVSKTTVSHMINEKWDGIADDMWRKVAAQVGCNLRVRKIFKTSVFVQYYNILHDAQKFSTVKAVIGSAGCGKSETSKEFEKDNKNVFRVECSEYFNRKTFLMEVLRVMGIDAAHYTVHDMVNEVVRILTSKAKPILLLDEADKLSDQVLYFFITLYNKLHRHCAIIISATDFLKNRILRGVKYGRKGFAEIYSRIGRMFLELNGLTANDITGVCYINGVKDGTVINKIISVCQGDLRVVFDMIDAYFDEKENAA